MDNPFGPYVWGCHANSVDLSPKLREFSGPMMFLRADPLYSAISTLGVQSIVKMRPGAKIIEFPGSSHLIHASQFKVFEQRVRSFILGLNRVF